KHSIVRARGAGHRLGAPGDVLRRSTRSALFQAPMQACRPCNRCDRPMIERRRSVFDGNMGHLDGRYAGLSRGWSEAMGTRINLLLDHDLAGFRNARDILCRLEPTTKAAEAVRDYWLASDPDSPHDPQLLWEAVPESPRQPNLRGFTGPGCLFL